MSRHRVTLERCVICGAFIRHGRVLITVKTTMEKTRASRSTVQRWIREHKIECVRLPRGRLRIYLDSLFNQPTSAGAPEASRRSA